MVTRQEDGLRGELGSLGMAFAGEVEARFSNNGAKSDHRGVDR